MKFHNLQFQVFNVLLPYFRIKPYSKGISSQLQVCINDRQWMNVLIKTVKLKLQNGQLVSMKTYRNRYSIPESKTFDCSEKIIVKILHS